MSTWGGATNVTESWTGHDETNWVIHPNSETQRIAAIAYIRNHHQGDPEGAAEILAALGLDCAA